MNQIYSTKIHKAIEFATIKHQNQKRKGSGLPYIVHPMEVMQILTENDCTEDVIIAGLLHDTLEDTATKNEEIEKEFGKTVLNIVLAESEDKSKSWKERKQHTIKSLQNESIEAKLVCCADKLSNVKSMYSDLQNKNDSFWKRFNAPKENIKWYYEEIVKSLSELSKYKMYDELKYFVNEVFGK